MSKQLRVSRPKLVSFFAKQSAATVLLEACGSAHFWARTLRRLGHDVVLVVSKNTNELKTRDSKKVDASAHSRRQCPPVPSIYSSAPGANTDTKLLIYGLFQKGRVLAQDAVALAVLIDERHHHLGWRSSSAWAKNADALRRISFARLSSRTSRSSALSRVRSSVVSPTRLPVSRSA